MSEQLNEEFVLVLVTGYPDEVVGGEGEDELRPEFREAIRRDVNDTVGGDVEVTATGYGYGGDTLAVAVYLSSLTALFLAGKSIRDNADAWVDLGRRLLALTKRLERFNIARLSEPAALSVAMAAIADKEAVLESPRVSGRLGYLSATRSA